MPIDCSSPLALHNSAHASSPAQEDASSPLRKVSHPEPQRCLGVSDVFVSWLAEPLGLTHPERVATLGPFRVRSVPSMGAVGVGQNLIVSCIDAAEGELAVRLTKSGVDVYGTRRYDTMPREPVFYSHRTGVAPFVFFSTLLQEPLLAYRTAWAGTYHAPGAQILELSLRCVVVVRLRDAAILRCCPYGVLVEFIHGDAGGGVTEVVLPTPEWVVDLLSKVRGARYPSTYRGEFVHVNSSGDVVETSLRRY